jgi:hypothetical protein
MLIIIFSVIQIQIIFTFLQMGYTVFSLALFQVADTGNRARDQAQAADKMKANN